MGVPCTALSITKEGNMKHIYRYWIEKPSNKEGYSVAEITYHAESHFDGDGKIEEVFGKERKTLKAAINDGKKFYEKNPDALVSIYAFATLTSYYDDGTEESRPDTDCARIGSIHNGEYFDLHEQHDWL